MLLAILEYIVTASYGQYSVHGVATGTTKRVARATRHQISAIRQ